MENFKLEKGNALVVVSHPDDETIWMGGAILSFPNIRWHIFSLCRADDPDRAPKFKKVCDFYKAKYFISNLEDENIMSVSESVSEIKKRIMEALLFFKKSNFEYIFTHGKNGEYGHPRHKGVNIAASEMLSEGPLAGKEVFNFAYSLSASGEFCRPNRKAENFILRLSSNAFNKKKFIIQKLYGFTESSFESQSCSEVETFKLL